MNVLTAGVNVKTCDQMLSSRYRSHVTAGGDIQPPSAQVWFTCLSDSEEERTRRKTTTTTGSDETAADQNRTDETRRFMFGTDCHSNYRLCVVTPVN